MMASSSSDPLSRTWSGSDLAQRIERARTDGKSAVRPLEFAQEETGQKGTTHRQKAYYSAGQDFSTSTRHALPRDARRLGKQTADRIGRPVHRARNERSLTPRSLYLARRAFHLLDGDSSGNSAQKHKAQIYVSLRYLCGWPQMLVHQLITGMYSLYTASRLQAASTAASHALAVFIQLVLHPVRTIMPLLTRCTPIGLWSLLRSSGGPRRSGQGAGARLKTGAMSSFSDMSDSRWSESAEDETQREWVMLYGPSAQDHMTYQLVFHSGTACIHAWQAIAMAKPYNSGKLVRLAVLVCMHVLYLIATCVVLRREIDAFDAVINAVDEGSLGLSTEQKKHILDVARGKHTERGDASQQATDSAGGTASSFTGQSIAKSEMVSNAGRGNEQAGQSDTFYKSMRLLTSRASANVESGDRSRVAVTLAVAWSWLSTLTTAECLLNPLAKGPWIGECKSSTDPTVVWYLCINVMFAQSAILDFASKRLHAVCGILASSGVCFGFLACLFCVGPMSVSASAGSLISVTFLSIMGTVHAAHEAVTKNTRLRLMVRRIENYEGTQLVSNIEHRAEMADLKRRLRASASLSLASILAQYIAPLRQQLQTFISAAEKVLFNAMERARRKQEKKKETKEGRGEAAEDKERGDMTGSSTSSMNQHDQTALSYAVRDCHALMTQFDSGYAREHQQFVASMDAREARLAASRSIAGCVWKDRVGIGLTPVGGCLSRQPLSPTWNALETRPAHAHATSEPSMNQVHGPWPSPGREAFRMPRRLHTVHEQAQGVRQVAQEGTVSKQALAPFPPGAPAPASPLKSEGLPLPPAPVLLAPHVQPEPVLWANTDGLGVGPRLASPLRAGFEGDIGNGSIGDAATGACINVLAGLAGVSTDTATVKSGLTDAAVVKVLPPNLILNTSQANRIVCPHKPLPRRLRLSNPAPEEEKAVSPEVEPVLSDLLSPSSVAEGPGTAGDRHTPLALAEDTGKGISPLAGAANGQSKALSSGSPVLNFFPLTENQVSASGPDTDAKPVARGTGSHAADKSPGHPTTPFPSNLFKPLLPFERVMGWLPHSRISSYKIQQQMGVEWPWGVFAPPGMVEGIERTYGQVEEAYAEARTVMESRARMHAGTPLRVQAMLAAAKDSPSPPRRLVTLSPPETMAVPGADESDPHQMSPQTPVSAARPYAGAVAHQMLFRGRPTSPKKATYRKAEQGGEPVDAVPRSMTVEMKGDKGRPVRPASPLIAGQTPKPVAAASASTNVAAAVIPFKLSPDRSAVRAGGLSPAAQGRVQFGLHVLVVDDEMVNRHIACRYLERLGCTYEMLEDGKDVPDALLMSSKPFDAILLDILMKYNNGLEVCRSLRQDMHVQIPIIAATANYSATEAGVYRQAGFTRVLQKPYNRSDLAAALTQALGINWQLAVGSHAHSLCAKA